MSAARDYVPAPMTPAARAARVVLDLALDDLALDGVLTPCQLDPAPFVSDEREQRQQAAPRCAACPVREPCGVYAEAASEPLFVWAGIDRKPRHRVQTTTEPTTEPTTKETAA